MNNSFDFWERFLSVIIAILAALGGPAGFLLGKRQREADARKTEAESSQVHSAARKLDAETLATITAVYQGVINELRGELKETNDRLDKLEKESREKDGRIEKLETENRQLKWQVSQLEQQLNGKEDKT